MFHGFGMHRHHRGKMFERGALKYLTLDLINEKPRHGYDIIQELEECSGGYYSPSPGSIYPTLQMLEDLGHIAAKGENGKKVYEITDGGRNYLKTHKESVKKHRDHMSQCFGSPGSEGFGSIMHEMKEMMYSMKHFIIQAGHSARHGNISKEKISAIKEVLAKAKKDIEGILKENTND